MPSTPNEVCPIIPKVIDTSGWRADIGETWQSRHRGPFLLCVRRPAIKPKLFITEWLKGEVDKDELEETALALLDDPRDTILDVSAWSIKEAMFVMTWRKSK